MLLLKIFLLKELHIEPSLHGIFFIKSNFIQPGTGPKGLHNKKRKPTNEGKKHTEAEQNKEKKKKRHMLAWYRLHIFLSVKAASLERANWQSKADHCWSGSNSTCFSVLTRPKF